MSKLSPLPNVCTGNINAQALSSRLNARHRSVQFNSHKRQALSSFGHPAQKTVDETFAEIAEKHPNIRIVDPVATMCRGDLCSASRDGLPLYWDDDHFNHHGSKIVLEPLLSPIFEQLEMALRTTATVPMQ